MDLDSVESCVGLLVFGASIGEFLPRVDLVRERRRGLARTGKRMKPIQNV